MDLPSKKRTYSESQGSENIELQRMRDRPSSPLVSSSDPDNLKPSIPLHLLPLSGVLGSGVSVDLLQKLYSTANGNVEMAVNKYFEGSVKEDSTEYDILKEVKTSHTETLIVSRQNQKNEHGKAQWERKYIGEIMAQGWASCTTKLLIRAGSRVRIERQYTVSTQNKKVSKNKNIIVRFITLEGSEVGRLPADIAKYVSKLLDFGCIELEGTVVACQEVIKTGDNVLLQLRCFLTKRCFLVGVETLGRITSGKSSTLDTYFGSIHKPIFNKSAETDAERLLNEKKVAMLALLKNVGVKAIRRGTGVNVDIENTYRDIAAATELNITDKKKIGYGVGGSSSIGTYDEEENIIDEEEKEIPDEQLDDLYSKAQKFDEMLEEREPSPLFSLELRGYQKQALSWMIEKETNLEDRKKASLHPLWEEYAFPLDPEMSSFRVDEDEELFYLNPYSGEMDLRFQSADSQCRGGILADEMGLGKTIEICALIQTNRPETFDSISNNFGHAENKSPTTLIVCPMSLLAQWRDECTRASEPNTTNIDVYYGGNKDRTLRDSCCRWNGRAPDILITSYGTMISEFQISEKTSKDETIELLMEGGTPKEGLFGINFWRVILDEAHMIKNRNSRTAKACYALNADRRWVVTGTPIQNKLEDLFSLVHFLRFEPWSNYSFWRTFITVPFERKDARALEVMQTVLEPLVLRRTKAMKGPNGVPLVQLPEKVIDIEYLNFKDEEQDIYDSLFEGAKTKFSCYVGAGKVLSNFVNIFQLLMRLRQVCNHPYLVLENKMTVAENLISKNGQVSLKELIAKFSSADSKSFGANVMRKLMNGDEDLHKECPVCFENIESPVLTPCAHMVCRTCVLDYLQRREHQGEEGECPVCRKGPLTEGDLVGVARKRRSFIEDDDDDSLLTDDTKDDADAGPSQKRVVDLRYDTFKSSTKLDALLKYLIALRRSSPKIKSVVFSQFTTFLDLIEIVLKRDDFSFVRFDGTMDQPKRERILREFRDGSPTVMLISLKAGGVGLNLTSASWVFMMDCWWNYAVEAQAIDRVHRIGQKNKVVVKRFIIKGSVEERILRIQERKNVLASGVGIRRDEAGLKKVEELKLLFGEKDI